MYRMLTIAPDSEWVVSIGYSPLQFAIDIIHNFGNTNMALEHKVKSPLISFIFFLTIYLNDKLVN